MPDTYKAGSWDYSPIDRQQLEVPVIFRAGAKSVRQATERKTQPQYSLSKVRQRMRPAAFAGWETVGKAKKKLPTNEKIAL
jgi:hypothetical protein